MANTASGGQLARKLWETLAHQQRLGRVAAGRLADQVREVTLSHPDGEVVTSCPTSFSGPGILAFSYAAEDVDIWESVSGVVRTNDLCTYVANGYVRSD
jgi:hypothetical protein